MQGKVYGNGDKGSVPSEKVTPLFYRKELTARALGMSLQDFLERKALLLRQVEEVKKALMEAAQEGLRKHLHAQGGNRDA